MVERPMVSVVMPLYNTARYVTSAIKSIQAQSLQQWELVIVDDASTDGSFEIVTKLAETDSRIHLYRNERNMGIVYTRNHGVERCSSPYVCMMDPDDVSLPHRLMTEYQFMEENPDIDLVSGWAQVIDRYDNVLSAPIIREDFTDSVVLRTELLKANQLVQSAVAFRRSSFQRAGGYRDVFEIGEDYDLWLRLTDAGSAVIINETLIQYRRSENSITVRKPACMFAYTTLIQRCAEARSMGQDDSTIIAEFHSLCGPTGKLSEELAVTLVSGDKLAIIARDLSAIGDKRGRRYAFLSLGRYRELNIHNVLRNVLLLMGMYPFLRTFYVKFFG